MIGWRNKDTGVFHAHAVRTAGDIQFTGCGRFRVIADDGHVRPGYEFGQIRTTDRRCRYCVDELRRAVEHALYWLGEDA